MWPNQIKLPRSPGGSVEIDGEVVIRRPVEDVFDFVADERNEPTYNPRMLRVAKLTGGPIGEGTRWRAETMTGRRGRASMVIELTGFERPSRIDLTTHMRSMDLDGSVVFVPVSVGTLMLWAWHLHPHGALRLAGPLLAIMGRRNERTIWSGLKEVLEEGRGQT